MNPLASALTEALGASPNHLVVLADGSWRHHPWPEVLARAQNVAERLLDDDVSGVGLVGDPTVEFVACVVGAFLAGSPVSILPGPIRGADPGDWAHATLARFQGIGIQRVFADGAHLDRLSAAGRGPTVEALGDVASERRRTAFEPPVVDAPVAILQGTAGSTGAARTVRLSPEAVLANLTGLNTRIGTGTATVGCSWLPLYHDMGLSFLLSGAVAGADVWQAPTAAFQASPFRWLTWLTESRATVTAAPNMAYGLIGKYSRRVADVDLGALGFALNGGEPVDCDLTERFAVEMARFGFSASALAPSYGLAESTCAVTVPHPGTGLLVDEAVVRTPDGVTTRRRAVLGDAIPGAAVRIAPTDAVSSGDRGREIGEVLIRGSSMMSGYLGDRNLDAESWFATGDLGYVVDDGLVVCGRAKEIITIAGRNVFPAEVERAAATVPGVREGAVVAVGIGERSIRPGLAVVAEFRGPDEAGARVDLIAKVASECGVVPADVTFVRPGALPRTSSGKLRRLEVRRRMEESHP